ncbi:MAG: helix-turn-helix domain containing protein [Eubacteriales bacterium]|nr:helix-turn-helix domain containing protein [Eubacteriales bacterium]
MKDTHQHIITAAKELFEKKGFAAATTKEIAMNADVSEVTLFRHFNTKRNLFEETVHGCIHPYVIDEYLKNGATYDLEHDLTHIAHNIMETYKQNMPMLKMIMRDKIRGSAPELHVQKNERCAENNLLAYFTTMKKMGKINAEPKMAIKFFVTNITGYFMREIFLQHHKEKDGEYFAWMLKTVISSIKAK